MIKIYLRWFQVMNIEWIYKSKYQQSFESPLWKLESFSLKNWPYKSAKYVLMVGDGILMDSYLVGLLSENIPIEKYPLKYCGKLHFYEFFLCRTHYIGSRTLYVDCNLKFHFQIDQSIHWGSSSNIKTNPISKII